LGLNSIRERRRAGLSGGAKTVHIQSCYPCRNRNQNKLMRLY
jgi:hypothetical protein